MVKEEDGQIGPVKHSFVIVKLAVFLCTNWKIMLGTRNFINIIFLFILCFSLIKGLNTQNIRLHFLYRQYTNVLYFNWYLNTVYAAHYVYFIKKEALCTRAQVSLLCW